MAEADREFELLSAYIDGELSADEVATLHDRMAADPNLAGAIQALRSERQMRAELWPGFEPDEAAVARLIDRVDGAIDRQTIWAHRLANLRIISSAAACIVVGLIIGRVAFGPRGGPIDSSAMPLVTGPGVTTVGSPIGPPTGPTQVRIVDSNNNPVSLQFSSPEEAQRFSEELQRWQQAQEHAKTGQGLGVPLSEKF